MHAPLFGYEPGQDSGLDEMIQKAAGEAASYPETILIELPKPVLLIKHSVSATYHIFELWVIPAGEEFQKLLDACVASRLLLTFEGGLKEARRECQDYIDETYPNCPVLWVEKETVIEAVEKD
jgi:hypothetical protein